MDIKTYLIINEASSIVENIVLWDGIPTSWKPPPGYIALPKDSTLSKVWQLDTSTNTCELVSIQGQSEIGFYWDGLEAVTPQSNPNIT